MRAYDINNKKRNGAAHSKEEISRKAIKLLFDNLDEIAGINNPELQASFLRYLAIHTRGNMQRRVVSNIRRIKSKEVKDTSLDYFTLYSKDDK